MLQVNEGPNTNFHPLFSAYPNGACGNDFELVELTQACVSSAEVFLKKAPQGFLRLETQSESELYLLICT